jgi:transcriptional regulator with XRE-family HTH domain
LGSSGHRQVQFADRHVGARVRERRVVLGLTQQRLAGLIGVTCQQVYKYERGGSRIAAARLYQIARALGVDVGYFFGGLDGGRAPEAGPQRRKMLELARDFAGIPDARQRAALSNLARVLVGG